MTRTDLVKEAAQRAEMTQKAMKEAVDAYFETAKDVLASGEEVAIADGLKLIVKDVEERQARNPQTGEAITIPAHRTVKAKIGKALKDVVA